MAIRNAVGYPPKPESPPKILEDLDKYIRPDIGFWTK
ncbi:hypothetical protein CCACVL1_28718 [Corchorus capsularis]|uniref:Uncharacterized protein n=1 Tax=Corchorus capsularis TaxID=210143 RepID=A0A1R3G5G6_COCAP|nr:hypothetical protein CCACVL1_28718 [Corchorus capsularis]